LAIILVIPVFQPLPSGANWETSADGIEFMDTTLKTLIVALRAIRDQADSIL
jgi:hypothetical protein